MASFRAIAGYDLARVLTADGWSPETLNTTTHVVLWKGTLKPVAFVLHRDLTKKQITALCQTARLSAERFEELLMTAPPPWWLKPITH